MREERATSKNWDPRWNALLSTAVWTVLTLGACIAAYVHFDKTEFKKPEPASPPQQSEALKRNEKPPVAAVSARPVRVVLTAHEEAWVDITADGKNRFTGVLQPNDTREVDADELIKLTTGNAGGVAVTLNQKLLDSLGPAGQVRTVRLTAEGPQFASRTPPQPPPASDPL